MAAVDLMRVRVEDGSSMGRSYTSKSNKQAGLGEARSKLTTKSFNLDDDSEQTPRSRARGQANVPCRRLTAGWGLGASGGQCREARR